MRSRHSFTRRILFFMIFCSLQITVVGKNINFEKLSVEDGLSQSSIDCIFQDDRGFIWFGTQDGLNRYDGYTFRVFTPDPEKPHSISYNYIRSLLQDRSGNLWVGTSGGLNRFDYRTEEFFTYRQDKKDQNSLPDDLIWTIYEDHSGILWIGTDAGLSRMEHNEDGTVRFIRYPVEPGNPERINGHRVRAILQDRTGDLWIGTENGLSKLTRDENGNEHITTYLPDQPGKSINHPYVKSLYEDRFGRLWIGTWGGGLNIYDPARERFFYFPYQPDDPATVAGNVIFTIYQDSKGIVWMGTWDEGIFRVHLTQNKDFQVSRYVMNNTIPDGLSNNRITAICEDHSGNIWFGTRGGGINKYTYNNKPFNTYRSSPYNPMQLRSNNIRGFCLDSDDILWIATGGGGLAWANLRETNDGHPDFHSLVNTPDDPTSLSNDYVTQVCEDDQGYIWCSTYGGGLNRFDKKTRTFRTFLNNPQDPYSISGDLTLSVYKDRSGKLWIGTYGNGLNYLDLDTKKNGGYRFIRFMHDPENPNSLGINDIRVIYQARDGVYWIGTWGSGLNKLEFRNGNPEKPVFKKYKPDRTNPGSFPANVILGIHEDKTGILWLGTYNEGVIRFNPKTETFRSFIIAAGLPNEVIYGVLEDDHGNLWMSHNKGLSKFDPQTETFINYDIDDGLQNNEYNALAFLKAPDGRMLFGGINGYNHFHPDSIRFNPLPPKVVLTDYQLFNKSIPIGLEKDGRILLKESINEADSIVLTHHDYVFSIEFAGLHYVSPEKNKYSYILENFESEWSTPGNRRFATYTNLPAGEYSFKVKASNGDGIWTGEGRSLTVIVTPPYWQTWWFRILAVLSIFISFAGFYQYRTYNMRKHNTELQTEIDERIKVEQALVKSERNYREIFNASSEAIFLHNADTGAILEVNKAMLDMYGYTSSEAAGLNVNDLSSGESPYSQKEAVRWIKKAIEEGPQIFEWRGKKKSGELFWVEVSLKSTEIHGADRVLAVVRDVNDRKQAQIELDKARNYIDNILNSMPSVLIGVSKDCTVTHWNDEAERITGINKAVATGQPLDKVIPSMSRELDNIINSIQSRRIISNSKLINIISRDRQQFSDLTVYPLISNGVEGAVIRVDDVTERVRLEEMMIQSEKMLSVGGLAAGMAHEINNPLAGILQNTQVILNRLTKPIPANEEVARAIGISVEDIRAYMEKRKILDMLQAITVTGKRAAKIVENMLGFSRKSASIFSAQDMIKILDDTLELAANDYDLKKKYDFRKIKIIKEYEDNVPLLHCERSNIQQVLLNIFKNGAQAMAEEKKEEKGNRKKEETCFVLRVKREETMIRIEIEDNGPGMDEETRKRAFEPFFTTKEVSVGTGLGLSVSYFIITEQHKGKMSIESAAGKGTKVIIDLPING